MTLLIFRESEKKLLIVRDRRNAFVNDLPF